MAIKTVLISQQFSRPIKVLKWKVLEGSAVSIGRVIFLYDFEDGSKAEQRKFKSTQAGTVEKLIVAEGAIVKPGEPLMKLRECTHPTVMKDMCAECGADLCKDEITGTASISMVHSIPELKVNEELAQKLGKADGERLLQDRKLVLLVDLDQTLIHTTNDNIPSNIKDVYHFQLYGPNSVWYHTRLRPGTHKFLKNMAEYFELHICTFGARNYAHMIAAFLDGEQTYFSNRILSRDECFDPTSKKANLSALFPCGDNMVCIIDDREDVWNHASNLIHVKPYHFFKHTGDINAPPGLDKQENDKNDGVDLSKITEVPEVQEEETPPDEETAEVEEKEKKEKKQEQPVKANGENTKAEGSAEEAKVANNVGESNTEESSKEEEESQIAKEPSGTSDNSNSNAESTETEQKAEESSDKKSNNVQSPTESGEPKEENSNTTSQEAQEVPNTSADASQPQNDDQNDDLIEIQDPDEYLMYLEDILKLIHKRFYELYDKMESGKVPDLKEVIPNVRSEVLKGAKLVFSGLVPTHIKLEQSKAYQVARSLGAVVTQDIDDETTHLVAVRPGTAKVNAGRRKKSLKIVTPDWLWSCAERWEHIEESIYPLSGKGSKNRHPPPHCSSPEHVPNYPTHEQPALRKRTPSGRFMDTINPLMSFSSDDIADMDKEVEDILDDESDEEDTKPVDDDSQEAVQNEEGNSQSSSSSAESLTSDFPRGFKRMRSKSPQFAQDGEELTNDSTLDEYPSAKFMRGEDIAEDLDLGDNSSSNEGSVDPPDECDDGEWNMMGAALEREFLSND